VYHFLPYLGNVAAESTGLCHGLRRGDEHTGYYGYQTIWEKAILSFFILSQGRPQRGGGGACRAADVQNSPKLKFKKPSFVDIMISKGLRDLPFSQNQPLKSADDYYISILKNKLIKLKKQEETTVCLSHGTCSYVRMYINAAAGSVLLSLQHDFYNIIFKIENKLYITSGSAPTRKIRVAHLVYRHSPRVNWEHVKRPLHNCLGTLCRKAAARNLKHARRRYNFATHYREYFFIGILIF
jgi:hypothetical protein